MYNNDNNNSNNNNNKNHTTESTTLLTLASLLTTKPAAALSSSSRAKRLYGKRFDGPNLNIYWLLMLIFTFLAYHQQYCECRYLPTRSRGDDLDKLRELMLQILESSNENIPMNEYNRPSNDALAQSNWLQAANHMNNIDVAPQNYRDTIRFPYNYNGRYYYY